jgi:hypothetical protein
MVRSFPEFKKGVRVRRVRGSAEQPNYRTPELPNALIEE